MGNNEKRNENVKEFAEEPFIKQFFCPVALSNCPVALSVSQRA